MENNLDSNFVKIVELNKDETLIENITNLLKENNIKFKIELDEHWTIPYKYSKYIPIFSVYVEKKFEKKAINLIENLTKSNLPMNEDLLEETPNDPTESQAIKVKKFRKKLVAIYMSIILIIFIVVMLYNILS